MEVFKLSLFIFSIEDCKVSRVEAFSHLVFLLHWRYWYWNLIL